MTKFSVDGNKNIEGQLVFLTSKAVVMTGVEINNVRMASVVCQTNEVCIGAFAKSIAITV